ncbi:MAG: MFS transporter [Fimbriimonadales bacterium]|nr:MFS transporter [Fimbriimonadales bacterium]
MHQSPLKQFPVARTLLLGAMFMGMGMTLPIFNHFVPIYLREMGLSATLVTFVLTWDNYINMFMQPVVGQLSDSTRTRLGRRKPWVMAGAPIALTAFLFVPGATTATAIMTAIFLTNFGNALIRSPGVALIGDLYPSAQRSLANGMINLMLGVGAALAYYVGGVLYGQFGRHAPFIFGSSVMFAALLVAVFLVHEPKLRQFEAEEKEAGLIEGVCALWRERNASILWMLGAILSWFMAFTALEALLSLIGKEVLGIPPDRMGQIVALLPLSFVAFALPSGALATYFGRKVVILAGIGGLTCMLLYGYFVQSLPMMIGFLLLAGMFWALINVNSLPALYDTAPQLRAGIITGLYYLASNLAAVLGPQLAGILVDWTGGNYRNVFLYGAFFMALAGGCMSRVRVR